jgi:hypothetical protein
VRSNSSRPVYHFFFFTFFEPDRVAEDFLTAEEDLDFEIVLDFIVLVFEEELFTEEVPEDPLLVVLLFPLERMLVILPRVELVFLDLVSDESFGMFLSSEDSVFSGFAILTLGEVSGERLLSLRVFKRILLLFVCSIFG